MLIPNLRNIQSLKCLRVCCPKFLLKYLLLKYTFQAILRLCKIVLRCYKFIGLFLNVALPKMDIDMFYENRSSNLSYWDKAHFQFSKTSQDLLCDLICSFIKVQLTFYSKRFKLWKECVFKKLLNAHQPRLVVVPKTGPYSGEKDKSFRITTTTTKPT